jgi:hypothetical protein
MTVVRGSTASKALGKRTFYQQVCALRSHFHNHTSVPTRSHQLPLPLAEAYTLCTSVMADAVVSPAAQEGIEAFLQKRAADFSGK